MIAFLLSPFLARPPSLCGISCASVYFANGKETVGKGINSGEPEKNLIRVAEADCPWLFGPLSLVAKLVPVIVGVVILHSLSRACRS